MGWARAKVKEWARATGRTKANVVKGGGAAVRLTLSPPLSHTPRKELKMWYFVLLLGLPLAAIFAVMNARWLEMKDDERSLAEGIRVPVQEPQRQGPLHQGPVA